MLTLTLLEGPLAGRPIPLPPGTFTLGDSESDVAVTLENGARIALRVDTRNVALLGPAPVWIDGMPLDVADADADVGAGGDANADAGTNAEVGAFANGTAQPAQVLPLHTVIDLAGLGVWFGDGSEPLPVPLPHRPARCTTPIPQPTTPAARETPPRRAREWQRSRTAWVAISCLSLLIASAGVAIWRTGTATVISAPPQPDALKALAARIAPGATLRTTGNAVHLSGGCLDDSVIARLRAEARWLGKALSDGTWCPENAAHSARTLLRLHGYGTANVSVAPDGVVVIGDVFVADARWRAASDALDALSLPHGWRVADGASHGFERLVRTLRDAGQLRSIDISRDRHGWRLTGALTAGRQASLKGIADTWNAASRGLPIRIEPLPSPIPTLAETGFSAPLVSIGGAADSPQLTLADGTRLAQGVRLPGGTRVIAIDPDGVSIGAHDRLFYLPLTPTLRHDDSSDAH
ncbi:type III secretion system inner membrane ring subunit SctD [Pandoraea pulmonicola]|uniref:EscD/YscD/HrpQ family type III secretion system inner membrane ring protein n=1 Tax=Pandoraea pulmonicola TaxID=93221 RepID=A0AAJ4ZBH0_PANPU|nr:type III secretion system inner membrane ring subunit SctD [Pandoraea pulmonicola]AJC21152.1 EscD/YscD/HrpQ family type III secretion system inner membrane ring protein [Pandoraea pulmonicola]SUA90181.1 type III secretion system protein SsaD [Pandoraea pulmonicola]